MSTGNMWDRLVSDHRRIDKIASDLKALLGGAIPADLQKLASARWAFASALMQHLAIKERHIYAKLENDSRDDVRAFSEKSKADLMRRFAAYTSHMQDWPTAKAVDQWMSYGPRAIAVVDAFTDRLKWEETDLIRFVERHDIDIAMPSSATANWVRHAFEVKTSVENGVAQKRR